MGRYVLTEEAAADLQQIKDYIASDSISHARRVIGELKAAMMMLADSPTLGHTREDLTDELVRFWTVYHYYIIYRPDSSPLEVIAIISGYRNVTKELRGRS